MKERPILMAGEMVKAILDGRKYQTRRVIRPQPVHNEHGWSWRREMKSPPQMANWTNEYDFARAIEKHHTCPYGRAGDRLWIRETWQSCPECFRVNYLAYGNEHGAICQHCDASLSAKWKPSIHMYRGDSRITLEVTAVRVERVQEITPEDALAEGVNRISHGREGYYYSALRNEQHHQNWVDPVDALRQIWDSINAKRGYSWESNPWVWVVEFKRVNE